MFRVISGYAVICFVILQIADVAFEPLGIGHGVLRVIIAGMLLALPLVGYLSWIFDLDPEMKLERSSRSRPRLEASIAIVAIAVFAFGAWLIIKPQTSDLPLSTPTKIAAEAAALSSLAVIPLNSIGQGSDLQWLTHGITSELTELLATIPRIQVASQSSAFALNESGVDPLEIGRTLGVEGLLVGSLQVLGEQIDVKMELLNTRDAQVLWRQSFSGSASSPHELQMAIAGQIFNYFGQQYSSYNYNRPKSAEAYKAHLKRMALEQTSDTEELLKWAELTTSLEPEFAMGYVNTVFPYLYTGVSNPTGPWREKIRTALDKAASLGISNSREYKTYEGLYQWVVEGDLNAAETLLREAFESGDYYGRIFYSRLLASSGLNKEVTHLFERLTVTEPYADLHWSVLAERQAYQENFLAAISSMNRMIELTPTNFFDLEMQVAMYSLTGQSKLANEAIMQLRDMPGYPAFRLATAEVTLNYSIGNVETLVNLAQNLAENNIHTLAAQAYLLAGDSRAEQQFTLVQSAPVPLWGLYWMDSYEWKIPAEHRNSKLWRDFRAYLGYTDEWRLEACRRVSRIPSGLGLACNPEEYALN